MFRVKNSERCVFGLKFDIPSWKSEDRADCYGFTGGAPEGNVTEEKQQEVKEEAKPEEPVAEAKPKPEGVNIEKKLEEREGIYYVKDSDSYYLNYQ